MGTPSVWPASFEAMFRTATGHAPPAYLTLIARDGLPATVRVPGGTGQAGVILAWLWRRLHGPDPAGTPRRLVYALPARSLLEPAVARAARWLANLGLTDQVALHAPMGPEGNGRLQWRSDMDRPAIVIGTTDALASKALNRGYGTGTGLFPIDFALVTSGAHWIIEETRLCPQTTVTLRQVAEFARRCGTAEPFGLTCMTASGSPGGPGGSWLVRRLDVAPGDYPAIATAVAARHRPGTLTLAVLATVPAAARVYQALDRQPVPCLLLHPQFRGAERAELLRRLAEPPGAEGRIVVVTRPVQAAVGPCPAALVAEAGAWAMTVRAACRDDHDDGAAAGSLWWIPPAGPRPGLRTAAGATCAELARLEGRTVTRDDLLAREPGPSAAPAAVLTDAGLTALFDTGPAAGEREPDIARYVRDADDLDVQLTWATWPPPGGPGQAAEPVPPPDDARFPAPEFRCMVPMDGLAAFLRRDGVAAWRPDPEAGGWARLDSITGVRPGDVVLVAAGCGGYDPGLGFDPAASAPVPGCPGLVAAADLVAAAGATGRDWVSLDRHSAQTRDQAGELLAALDPRLPPGAAQAAATAAYVHDLGKAHPIWQDALCQLAPPGQAAQVEAGRPWAKSGTGGRLIFAGSGPFRHELASLLMLDGPMRGMLSGLPDPDLARYLVLAHHGRLRTQVPDPGSGEAVLFGLVAATTVAVPPLLGQPAAELTVDLSPFTPAAGGNGWGRTAALLRDRYGPFVLAYLETIVRIADWRASALAAVSRSAATTADSPGCCRSTG